MCTAGLRAARACLPAPKRLSISWNSCGIAGGETAHQRCVDQGVEAKMGHLDQELSKLALASLERGVLPP